MAETFAKEQYRSYILVDFVDEDYGMTEMLESGLKNLDTIFLRLQLNSDVRLYERESVIIFDEVQRCPKAREMIKNLVKDRRYDYIETGSLISLKSNTRGIRIPSEEHRKTLHPMDFEEFLLTTGEGTTLGLLKQLFESGEPLGESTHSMIMEKFRRM